MATVRPGASPTNAARGARRLNPIAAQGDGPDVGAAAFSTTRWTSHQVECPIHRAACSTGRLSWAQRTAGAFTLAILGCRPRRSPRRRSSRGNSAFDSRVTEPDQEFLSGRPASPAFASTARSSGEWCERGHHTPGPSARSAARAPQEPRKMSRQRTAHREPEPRFEPRPPAGPSWSAPPKTLTVAGACDLSDSQRDDEPQPFRSLLLPVEEAAEVLRIGRSKVYELIASGELEAVHIGRCLRVPVGGLEDFVEALRRSRADQRGA